MILLKREGLHQHLLLDVIMARRFCCLQVESAQRKYSHPADTYTYMSVSVATDLFGLCYFLVKLGSRTQEMFRLAYRQLNQAIV